jgi:hypothetical protein
VTVEAYFRLLLDQKRWLVLILGLALAASVALFAIASDELVSEAVMTAKPDEARSFDLSSLSSLASLAGGGDRPTFEEFSFIVGSEANLRAALPDIRRIAPAMIRDMERRGRISTFIVGVDQALRALMDKSARVDDLDQRVIDRLKKRLDVEPTSEGFLRIALTSKPFPGGDDVIKTLIATADKNLRERAVREYQNRLTVYTRLLRDSTNVSQRAVLTTMIGREFATFASAQSGEEFAFLFIDPPRPPEPDYATPFLVLLLLLTGLGLGLYGGLVGLLLWFKTA